MRDGCVYRVGREQYHWVPYIFSKLGTPRYNLWEFVFFFHILAFCMNCFWSPHQFPNSSVFKISRNTSLFSLVTPWPRYKTFGLFSSSSLKSSFSSSSLLAVPVFLSCGGGGSEQQRWEGNQDRRLKMVNIRKLKKTQQQQQMQIIRKSWRWAQQQQQQKPTIEVLAFHRSLAGCDQKISRRLCPSKNWKFKEKSEVAKMFGVQRIQIRWKRYLTPSCHDVNGIYQT